MKPAVACAREFRPRTHALTQSPPLASPIPSRSPRPQLGARQIKNASRCCGSEVGRDLRRGGSRVGDFKDAWLCAILKTPREVHPQATRYSGPR
jgi:hypothetical protein